MNKVTIGIKGLDEKTGGLPKGRTYLLSGEPGTGKTIFSLQFLIEGAKKKEKGLYIAIDEKPEQIIENAQTLGWDLTPYLENKLITFLDVTEYFGSSRQVQEPLNYNRIITNIISFIEEHEIKRVVIDPITPSILTSHHKPEITYYIRKIILSLEGFKECTSILTSPSPVGTNRLSKMGIEEFLTSGVIVLKAHPDNTRTVSIKKMRGCTVDTQEQTFTITPKKGIQL